jgi:hypothetical protein
MIAPLPNCFSTPFNTKSNAFFFSPAFIVVSPQSYGTPVQYHASRQGASLSQ